MKKSEQIKINEKVEEMFSKCTVKGNWDSYAPKGIEWDEHRLRNCSATIFSAWSMVTPQQAHNTFQSFAMITA